MHFKKAIPAPPRINIVVDKRRVSETWGKPIGLDGTWELVPTMRYMSELEPIST